MNLPKHDIETMSEIANHGLPIINAKLNCRKQIKKLDLMMDLEYANDESPMDFDKFLAFNDGDFGHDICGIYANFNRETLKMDNCFSPRCTISENDVAPCTQWGFQR